MIQMDDNSNVQHDPVQMFMDGVSHLTGYLHRSLTLMKELDLQATEIGRTLKEKEEEYICRLHQRKKRKHPEELTSSETNSVQPIIFVDGNNYETNRIFGKEGMDSRKKESIYSDTEEANKKEQNKHSFKGIKLKIRKEHIENEKNVDESIERKEQSVTHSDKKVPANKIEEDVSEDKKKDITERNMNNGEEDKNKNHNATDVVVQNSEEKTENKKIKLNISYNKEIEHTKKEEIVKKNQEKKNHSQNEGNYSSDDYLRNYSDISEDEEETEEMIQWFNEIKNERNKCMDLLREKISINIQVSLMVKQDYEKLRKQFDVLYAEMEKKGESFNNMNEGFHLNKYSHHDLDNFVHSTNQHTHSYTNEYRTNSQVHSSIHTKNRNNYSRYNNTVHNIEQKQKNEENESVSSKSVYKNKNYKTSEVSNFNEKTKRNKKVRKNKKESTNDNGTVHSNANSQIIESNLKYIKSTSDKGTNLGLKMNSYTSKGNNANKSQASNTNSALNENEEKPKSKHKNKSNLNTQNSMESIGNISSLSNTKRRQSEKGKADNSKEKSKMTHGVSTTTEKSNTQKTYVVGTQEKKIPSSDETQQQKELFTVEYDYTKEDSEEGICPVCEKGESALAEFEMVCCDGCNKWFHFECVNYKNDDVDENWFCPKCITTDVAITNKTESNTNTNISATASKSNKKEKK